MTDKEFRVPRKDTTSSTHFQTSCNAANDLARDFAYQDAILQDVSRTFALTIPQLPDALSPVVGNAYLLCRIADTIEDSEALTMEQKRRFYDAFVAIVAGNESPDSFAEQLPPLLTGSTLEAERDLIRHTSAVIRITRSFTERQQAALWRCVRIMSQGMEQFQAGNFAHGLRDMAHLDTYCYHVAGVVGEMLAELFCDYSAEVAQHRKTLMRLSVSFGQGLQMTNILKDVWDDKQRGYCWLPQDVFARHGFDLATLSPENHGEGFQVGMLELIGVARGHLENALEYTLLLPTSERGLREFCLWALGMAVLTLRKLRANLDFTDGREVKISRRAVRGVIATTRLIGGSNTLLRLAFNAAARPLKY